LKWSRKNRYQEAFLSALRPVPGKWRRSKEAAIFKEKKGLRRYGKEGAFWPAK